MPFISGKISISSRFIRSFVLSLLGIFMNLPIHYITIYETS
jgi:4-hydroxybenzoate polyprenyltransferase